MACSKSLALVAAAPAYTHGHHAGPDTMTSRALIAPDGKLRPIIRALIYATLAFGLLSADEFLGPPLHRAATALHATGLSPARDTFYETINLLTAFAHLDF
jgi:hypothetical protein